MLQGGMSLIGYARVSSLEQARDSSAFEQQKARLVAAGCTEIFSDVQSGTQDNRPELKKALALLGPEDTLIATRLDRITRSPKFNEKLLDFFAREGTANLRLLDDGLDVSTVAGRMTARLLSAVNAGEVERLAERVAHGRAHRQSKGGHGGKPPWGFLRAPDGLGLVVDPELEEVSRGAIEHFLRSRSIQETVLWLNRTHGIHKPRLSFRNWLKNPAIAGGIGRCAGTWVTLPDGTRKRKGPRPGVYDSIEWDRHQGLIPRATWTEVERALEASTARGASAHRQSTQRSWRTGHFRCHECGIRMGRHHGRLRCITADCSQRYGANSILDASARASICRAIEWMGPALVQRLAPLKAAMASREAVESKELLKLRSDLTALRALNIDGTGPLIAEKEKAIEQEVSRMHGSQVTTAQLIERLTPLFAQPWELTDQQLLEAIDDAELGARVENRWVIEVASGRFGFKWSFDPATKKERFELNDDSLSPEDQRIQLGLEEGISDNVALSRTFEWWEAVDANAKDIATPPEERRLRGLRRGG